MNGSEVEDMCDKYLKSGPFSVIRLLTVIMYMYGTKRVWGWPLPDNMMFFHL